MLIPISQSSTPGNALVAGNTPAAFDLLEQPDYYLLAIDLPSLENKGSEIALGKNRIEVLTGDPGADAEVLFRCQSQSGGVRAVYFEGALWLMLPKAGARACAAIGA